MSGDDAGGRRCGTGAAGWRHARRPAAGRGEGGNAAVEFALILPILMLVLTGVVQIGMMLFIHSNMLHITQEAARQVAVGAMTTTQAQTWAQGQLVDLGFDYTVNVQEAVIVDEGDSGASTQTDVTATISVPLSDVALFDPLHLLPDRNLVASSVVRQQGL